MTSPAGTIALVEDSADIVCADTSKLTRSDWLAARRPYLGASDIAAAMGMSPYDSSYSLWCTKVGLLPERADDPVLTWRRTLEDPILDRCEQLGCVGPEGQRVARHVMLRSKAHPWMACNPDGIGAETAVQVKTAHSADEPRWDFGIPDHIALQVHHEMAVMGLRSIHLEVMFGCAPPICNVIERDESVVREIVSAGTAFMALVNERRSPDPDASEATMLALRERYFEVANPPETVEFPAEWESAFAIRAIDAQAVKTHTEAIDGLKTRCMEAMGGAEVGTISDRVVCTWKQRKDGGRTFRWAARKGSQ